MHRLRWHMNCACHVMGKVNCFYNSLGYYMNMILYIEIRNLSTHESIRSCHHNDYFVLQAALEIIPIALLYLAIPLLGIYTQKMLHYLRKTPAQVCYSSFIRHSQKLETV